MRQVKFGEAGQRQPRHRGLGAGTAANSAPAAALKVAQLRGQRDRRWLWALSRRFASKPLLFTCPPTASHSIAMCLGCLFPSVDSSVGIFKENACTLLH